MTKIVVVCQILSTRDAVASKKRNILLDLVNAEGPICSG